MEWQAFLELGAVEHGQQVPKVAAPKPWLVGLLGDETVAALLQARVDVAHRAAQR